MATGIAVAAVACTLAAGSWLAAREVERVARAVEQVGDQITRLASALEKTVDPAGESAPNQDRVGAAAAASSETASPTTSLLAAGHDRLVVAGPDGRLVVVRVVLPLPGGGVLGLEVERVYRLEVDERRPGPRHGVHLVDVHEVRQTAIEGYHAQLDSLTEDSMEAARNASRVAEIQQLIAVNRGFDVLLAELENDRAVRRRGAALALADQGFVIAGGVLVAMLADTRGDGRRRAEDLLAHLSGLDPREETSDDPDAALQVWRAWWQERSAGLNRWQRVER